MEAAYEKLMNTVSKQEEIIKGLEQEIKDLGELKIYPDQSEEESHLRVANEKLKYRIKILKTALDKELVLKA